MASFSTQSSSKWLRAIGCDRCRRLQGRQIGNANLVCPGGHHRLDHGVAQLADIARPGMALQRPAGFCRKPGMFRVLPQEVFRDGDDVVAPFPQRRHADLALVEPVKQIGAKPSGLHRRFQVLVGGGHDACIHRDLLLPSHAVIRYAVQNAEQLDLHSQLQFSDLIQKQRAGIRQIEQSRLDRVGAAEGALLVSE